MFQRSMFSYLLVFLTPLHALAASFTPLGHLSHGMPASGASGVSGDGNTVVGSSSSAISNSEEAVRWDTLGSISALRNPLTEDGLNRLVSSTSADGSVIVGFLSDDVTNEQHAFRWTASEGIVELGFLRGDTQSVASDVSSNGEVIAGTSRTDIGISRAYRWTAATGMVSLGTLPTSLTPSSNSAGISADGTIIVGTTTSGDSFEAFRWTQETGMVGLGDLSGGFLGSDAQDISADGSTIVGAFNSALASGSSIEAYRWTEATGMQALGFLEPSDILSSAEFVSANGRLVFGDAIGSGGSPEGFRSFVWDQQHGMRDLLDVLEEEYSLGSELAGWTQFRATDISDDSLSLVGSGINPDGNREAWLIQLNRPIGVPEPIAITVFLSSVCMLLSRRF